MRILLILAVTFFSVIAHAEEDRFVTDVNSKTLYIYDDVGEEIGTIKGDVVKRQFAPIPDAAGGIKGLKVENENAEEGLVSVLLQEYPDPVWIETMAVKIWPGNRLKCPEVTTGRAEIEQSGMTIGFGEHCDNQLEESE